MDQPRRFGAAPAAADIEAIARRTLDALPEPFASHLRDVVLLVEEFPMTVTGKIRKVQMREETTETLGLEPKGNS